MKCLKARHPALFGRTGGHFSDWCEACFGEVRSKPCIGCKQPITRDSRLRFCSPICQIKSHCLNTDDPNSCWPWAGALKDNGYGVVRVRLPSGYGLRTPARAMFAAVHGEVPETYSVLQTCGTKNCCNPAHLTLGVQELSLIDVELVS